MSTTLASLIATVFVFTALAATGCGPQEQAANSPAAAKTIRVAQSGQAEVIGADNIALQQAADMLKPGDTLVIGPGTYRMDNSLFIPCSDVVVRGTPGETILLKGPGPASKVVDGGDYGEDVLVLAEPEKFKPGMGISVGDDNYSGDWAITVTSIASMSGDTIRLKDRTLRDYDYETKNARVESKFPILCGIGVKNVTFEGITVDGNKAENPYFIDGCRGGAIYLYQSTDCTIRNCVARNYNGDGISFQITDNIQVQNCESYGNTNFGIHPGTGSPHAQISDSHFHNNDSIGFFLCWRVRYGHFTNNVIENNGNYGISIGHKDTDNLFANNTIRNNGFSGVYFRNETFKLSGHRNVFRNNTILDNGDAKRGYGVYVEPYAGDIVLENNRIGDDRQSGERSQRYGVYVVRGAGKVSLNDNRMEGNLSGEFLYENQPGGAK